MNAQTMHRLRDEAVAYHDLCAQAHRLGIPTSLDDPAAPRTEAELRSAVAFAAATDRLARDVERIYEVLPL